MTSHHINPQNDQIAAAEERPQRFKYLSIVDRPFTQKEKNHIDKVHDTFPLLINAV